MPRLPLRLFSRQAETPPTAESSAADLYLSIVSLAKAELARIDPEFVTKMEEMARASRIGLTHPGLADDKLPPPPKKRLSAKWYEVLEAAHDLYGTAAMFEEASNHIANLEPRGDGVATGRALGFAAYSWHIWANALVVKLRRVALKAARVTGKPEAEIGILYDRFLANIESKTKLNRDPALHGIGTVRGGGPELRPPSSAISEKKLWEWGVAIELHPEGSYEPVYNEPSRLPRWQKMFPVMTRHLQEQVAHFVSGVQTLIRKP